MFSRTAKAIFQAMRELVRNWPALAIMLATYAILLGGVYLFVTTKEATTTQVALTVLLAIAAPVLFFILQTVSAGYTSGTQARVLIADSIKNSWKLLVISLPVVAISILAIYGLARLQTYLGTSVHPVDPSAISSLPQTHSQNIQWTEVLFLSLRYLLIFVAAPLVLIHLWISTNRHGILQTLRRGLSHLRRAVAPESVLIYLTGFVVFALVPYFVLSTPITAKGAGLEITLFVTRLAVAFILTLLGWVLTMGALALTEEINPQVVTEDA
jgi:hypothetical protein